MVVLTVWKRLLQNFQSQCQWWYKIPPPMGPEIVYTTGAGKEVKVSVAVFPSGGGGV